MHALRAAAECIEGNADAVESELREFSYIVSHDLATEFRHVSEFAKLLIKDLEQLSAEGAWRSNADIIISSSARCQAMLGQLRLYSRAQQAQIAWRECDARRLVETALLQISDQLRQAGARVRIEVSGRVCGEEKLLVDAIRRVVENAAQFPRTGAPLEIAIDGADQPQGAWRLRVSDNGEGLERQYWDKAFGMFWRLEPHANPSRVGAGLAVVRRILRRHHGEARFVECEEGACIELALANAPPSKAGVRVLAAVTP
jgi:two-component system, chemotaxis family, sensor kinase Cph1